MKNTNTESKFVYGSIIVITILLFFFLFYIITIQISYSSKLSAISDNLISVQNDLQAKQKNINDLSSKVNDAILKYEMQIGELNQQVSDLSVESEGFSSIIPDVINSVVSVITNLGQGSGAIVSSDGYIVTNYHVIAGATRAGVLTYDGNTYGVSLVGYNVNQDIAVLKILSNDTFDYFEFGDSDLIKTGQKVVALGNPAGLSFTATEGIISSPSRIIEDNSYIQTDVTINPGNSGGPIINSQGEIIGLVNFKVSNYEELGFAIPSNRVKTVLDEILY